MIFQFFTNFNSLLKYIKFTKSDTLNVQRYKIYNYTDLAHLDLPSINVTKLNLDLCSFKFLYK
jgi:hypothetical protein